MTLRRITTDNGVRYNTQSEPTRERDVKPNTMKNNSVPRKQREKFLIN